MDSQNKQLISNIYATLILFLSLPIMLCSQNEFEIRHKIQNDSIMLRWWPENPQQWEHGNKVGYILEKYLKKGRRSELLYASEKPILPLEFDEWMDIKTVNENYLIARNLIHIDQLEQAVVEETFPKSQYPDERKEQTRMDLTNYFVSYHFGAIESAGLGFVEKVDDPDATYIYKIRFATPLPANPDLEAIIEVKPSDYAPPEVPELTGEFLDRKVNLKWNTKDFKKNFFGYYLEFSTDNISFTKKSEMPYMNPLDTAEFIEEFKYIKIEDTLTKNDTEVFYRLKGVDYFGGVSVNNSVLSGEGMEHVFSPIIESIHHFDTTYAELKWHIANNQDKNIAYFEILHADEMEGNFELLLTGIPKKDRKVLVEMKTTGENYYRVVAVDIKGRKKSSFPTLIMGLDLEAPLTPTGLTGEMDSLGIVKLTWDKNTEPDLWGYRVFYAQHKEDEFSGLVSTPLDTTIFMDTVSLNTTLEYVYYKIQSLDRRNNRSEYSEILAIKRPDTHAPVEPHIYSIEPKKDTILLQWYNSSSKDVVEHRLFRKEVKEEEWTLLGTFNINDNINEYYDLEVRTKETYAYFLTATDDDGLVSEPSQIAVIKPIDYGTKPDIVNFTASINETDKKAVMLQWEYDYPNVFEFWLYKQRHGGKLSLYKVLDPEDTVFKESSVKPKNRYHYYLKAIYKDGSNSPFSQKLVVEIPEN